MRKVLMCLAASILALATTFPAFAALEQFSGTWRNADRRTGGVTTLDIDIRGSNVMVRAWGQCEPQDCDWGRVLAQAYGPNVASNLAQSAQALTAVFRTGFSQTMLVIRAARMNRLEVETFTHFTDNSGRTDYSATYAFLRGRPEGAEPEPSGGEPVGAATPAEDCVSFNPLTTTVEQVGGSWKIMDGSHAMFDFGHNGGEAQHSLNIIKRYRMNQSCFVGRPDPSFRYLLASGRSPWGRMPGEDCIAFNPANLAVQNVGGRWKIVDGSNWLYDFGNNESEARQAFEIIRKYGFRFACYVGRPNPSFQYLRR